MACSKRIQDFFIIIIDMLHIDYNDKKVLDSLGTGDVYKRQEYKQQARLNDVICPARAVDENKTTVLLNDQKGEPYAVIEFK